MISTVGYGGNPPKSTGGKAFTVVLAIGLVPPAAFFLNDISNACIHMAYSALSRKRTRGTKASGLQGTNTEVVTFRFKYAMLSLMVHLMVCGGVAFSLMEDWKFGDACYFSFVSLTTIGLGDFIPQTKAGRGWLYFFLFAGLGIITIIVEEGLAIVAAKAVEKARIGSSKVDVVPLSAATPTAA